MATGTANLPNPGMSFSPFAILTAEEQNNLVENIESLATGSGQGDSSIRSTSIDQSSFSPLNYTSSAGGNGGDRVVHTVNYTFRAGIKYLILGSVQTSIVNGGDSIWEYRLRQGTSTLDSSRHGSPVGAVSPQNSIKLFSIHSFASDTTVAINIFATRLVGTNTLTAEMPRIWIAPMIVG